jgi:hypothetical protein
MSNKQRLVDLELEVKHETEKAWLVTDGEREVWLPKSLVENNEDGTFTMPEYLAQDKELI